MKASQVILVDTREKIPLIFPGHLVVRNPASPAFNPTTLTLQLLTVRAELETADYVLQGSTAVGVERKGSFDELWGNLATAPGRRRFLACLDRLRSAFTHPWIFLEGDPLSLQRVTTPGVNPSIARDLLLEALLEYNVSLICLPTQTASHRRAAAEWVASLLIQGAHRGTSQPS